MSGSPTLTPDAVITARVAMLASALTQAADLGIDPETVYVSLGRSHVTIVADGVGEGIARELAQRLGVGELKLMRGTVTTWSGDDPHGIWISVHVTADES